MLGAVDGTDDVTISIDNSDPNNQHDLRAEGGTLQYLAISAIDGRFQEINPRCVIK